MSNLTIKWRLLLSFAVVVLVVLSSMVVQLIYNNRLDNEVHRLALSYDLALKAESLDTQILTVVSSLRGFELTGTEANLTALEAAKKRAYELNDEMIAVWSRMGASRKDQLERAEKIKVLFNVLLKEVVEPCIIERKLVNEGKHDMNQMSEFVSKYSAGPRDVRRTSTKTTRIGTSRSSEATQASPRSNSRLSITDCSATAGSGSAGRSAASRHRR